MNNLLDSGGFTGGIGLASILGAALMVFLFLRLTGVVQAGQSVYQIGLILRFAAEAPVRLAIKPLLWTLFKIPSGKRIADFLWLKLTDESLDRFFDRRFRNSDDALLRGDIETVARERYPEAKYPHLWMSDIPEDLKRPLVIDGRLPNGASPASLAPVFIDTVLVGQSYRRAVLAAVFWAFVGFLAWHPQTYLGKTLKSAVEKGEARQNESMAAQRSSARANPENLAYLTMGVQLRQDTWDMDTLNAKVREQASTQQKIMENRRDSIIGSAPNGTITALLFGILVFLGTWRGLVREAAQQKIEPLRRQNKEAIIHWKYRLPERDIQYRAYMAQLKVLHEFDKTPLIDIGAASGLFRFRGQLSAPEKGQPMRMSLGDLMQHLLLLGGTGEGKTRSIILPIVNQLLALRAEAKQAGQPRQISFYATDGKAVLWRDIKEVAEKAGQGADVRVIGCNDAAGEFGVDLLEGVDPQLLADIIRSVMRQTKGGEGGDSSFWPDMASDLLRNCAVIARAWECTDDGVTLIGKTGERLYSLVMLYQMALDDELQERAVRAVLAALTDPAQWPYVAEYAGAELMDSIRYVRGQWVRLADATKTGITANVTNVMAPFASNVKLRTSFASGRSQRLMKITDVWGSISLVNVSNLEYGVAGRIVNVMLKTLLYTEARKREMANPTIGLSEKLLFIADEFQDLITADVAGMSDSNFWNVARSTGTIGFTSSQGMASLEQAVGRIAAENFALQMRSKIFLRVEDPATMEYAKKLAGKTLRSYTFESNRYESFEALIRETGVNPLETGPARIVELPNNYVAALAAGWFQVHKASLPISFDTWRAAVDVDLRFVPTGSLAHASSEEASLSAKQAAFWRQEDKTLAYMSEGNHEAEVLRDEDIISMGRAHAYVYLQRAGATRQDLAEIG